MYSAEPEYCSVCFRKVEKNTITISEKESVQSFQNWFTYLHAAVNKSIKEHQTDGETELTFCKSCYQSSVHLIQLTQDLILFEKEVSGSTFEFSVAVLHRRSQISTEENKQSTSNYRKSKNRVVQLDASGLPPQLFLTLPVQGQINIEECPENPEDNILDIRNGANNVKDPLNSKRVKKENCQDVFDDKSGTVGDGIESELCSVCFTKHTRNIITISDKESVTTFKNWFTYLHAAVSKSITEYLSDGETELKFCNNCYQSALHLVQLTQDLALFKKEISDLTLEYSVAVFHRRSQKSAVENKQVARNCRKPIKKQIIQLDATGLSPNLFSTLPAADQKIKLKEEDEKLEDAAMSVYTVNVNTVKGPLKDKKVHFEVVKRVKTEYCENLYDNSSGANYNDLFNDPESEENSDYDDMPPIIDCYAELNDKAKNEAVPDKKINSQRGDIKTKKTQLIETVTLPTVRVQRIQDDVINKRLTGRTSNASAPKSRSKILSKQSGQAKKLKRTLHRSKITPSANNMKIANLKQVIRKKRIERPVVTTNFPCKYCGRWCKSNADLTIHTRIHTGERPYKCKVCFKGFIQPQHLRYHELTHTGERPYSCLFCNKKFIGTSARDAHQRLHTGEKPYKCDYCDRRFNESGNKNRHMRVHCVTESFPCSFCDETFDFLQDKKRHEKSHTRFVNVL